MFYKYFFECYANENKTSILFGLFPDFFTFFFPTEFYGSCKHYLTCGIQWGKKKVGTQQPSGFQLHLFSKCVIILYKLLQQGLRVIQLSVIWPATDLVFDTFNLSIFQTSNFLIFIIFLFLGSDCPLLWATNIRIEKVFPIIDQFCPDRVNEDPFQMLFGNSYI